MTDPVTGGAAVKVGAAGTGDALADGARRAAVLATTLAGLGVRCAVEARGSLAVLTPEGAHEHVPPAVRHAVLDAAIALGFTHVALELRGEDG